MCVAGKQESLCWLGVGKPSSPLLPVTSAVADINRCIVEDDGDPVQTELALKNEFSQLGFLIDESCAERYHVTLQRARQEKGEVRSKRVG